MGLMLPLRHAANGLPNGPQMLHLRNAADGLKWA
jgi:hypothetical protein